MLATPHSFVDDGTKIYISSISGEGISTLLARIETEMNQLFFTNKTYNLRISDGKSLAWLHANGKVLKQIANDDNEYITVNVQLSEENIRRFEDIKQI
jgi:50S ribosomal subunit-associated GTPase HflX